MLENVLSAGEVVEFRREFDELLSNAPVQKGAGTDASGLPVRNPKAYKFAPPLSDPTGGSTFGIYNFKGGETKPRHHIKMRVPPTPVGAPAQVIENLNYPLAYLDSALYLYGNPKMLKVVEAINGPDFMPFGETFFYKAPFMGTSTSWHQDPSSAWDDEWASWRGEQLGTCGFNAHVSLGHCTPENALWVVPGSHIGGRKDQKSLSAQVGGTDRLPGAVPVVCGPGDVYVQNRLILHGAFPNTSAEPRISMNFGFHRKASVLGKHTKGGYSRSAGKGKTRVDYDEAWIHDRCRNIQMAIDARRQKYPDEEPYVYAPYKDRTDDGVWTGHHASPNASWNGLTRADFTRAALADAPSI